MKDRAEKQIRWFTSSEGTALVTEEAIYGIHVAGGGPRDGRAAPREQPRLLRARPRRSSRRSSRPATEVRRADRASWRRSATAPGSSTRTPAPPSSSPRRPACSSTRRSATGWRGSGRTTTRRGRPSRARSGSTVLPAVPHRRRRPDARARRRDDLAERVLPRSTTRASPRSARCWSKDGRPVARYLLSRKPVKPFTRSNGHGRSQGAAAAGGAHGRTSWSSRRGGCPMAELKQMLMAEAQRQGKPYGLVIRDITGGNTNTASYGYQAFKGTPRLVYRVDVAHRAGRSWCAASSSSGRRSRASTRCVATSDERARLQRLLRRRERVRAGLDRGAGGARRARSSCSGWRAPTSASPILPAPWDAPARAGARRGMAGALPFPLPTAEATLLRTRAERPRRRSPRRLAPLRDAASHLDAERRRTAQRRPHGAGGRVPAWAATCVAVAHVETDRAGLVTLRRDHGAPTARAPGARRPGAARRPASPRAGGDAEARAVGVGAGVGRARDAGPRGAGAALDLRRARLRRPALGRADAWCRPVSRLSAAPCASPAR